MTASVDATRDKLIDIEAQIINGIGGAETKVSNTFNQIDDNRGKAVDGVDIVKKGDKNRYIHIYTHVYTHTHIHTHVLTLSLSLSLSLSQHGYWSL